MEGRPELAEMTRPKLRTSATIMGLFRFDCHDDRADLAGWLKYSGSAKICSCPD